MEMIKRFEQILHKKHRFPAIHRIAIGLLAQTLALSVFVNVSPAQDSVGSAARDVADKVVAAAGGDGQLLKLFRMEERYNAGKERVSPGTARTSIVEPPNFWWIGRQERGKEPAKITAWAWTLGILQDPKSKLERIPEITEQDKTLTGLRVTGSVDPAVDLYFDQTTYQLVRVDWRNDIYRFSEWKEVDGTKYPAKTAMFRRSSGEPWFFHEIVTIERLTELPPGLQRQ